MTVLGRRFAADRRARPLLRSGFVVVLLASTAACAAQGTPEDLGKLAFRAHEPVGKTAPGRSALGLAPERDGFLFVPHDNDAQHRQPLMIMLHGATQRARLFERLAAMADTQGVVIVAPDSREYTWDAIRGEFGPDIAFIDRAVMLAFDRAFIDPCRVVIGGFSDGASYALSLGIRNVRSLHGVVAFSPGFLIPAQKPEKLPVFQRHGTRDEILPIDRTSRPLMQVLREAAFPLDYEEFDGPHTMRPVDARAAMEWVKARSCSPRAARS